MPRRLSVKRHSTEEVQGEESYVVLSSVKVREIRKLRKMSADETDDDSAFEGGIALLAKHLVDWNWVDDDDQPLSLPKDDIEVMDELTEEESRFLVNLMIGAEEAKN